jgi:hypothetical protein
MVEIIEEKVWMCPYCDKEYNNEADAEECATECCDIDSPIEDTRTTFKCEMCKKIFNENDDAEECEEEHTEDKDRFYKNYEKNIDLARLEQIANHPNQSKLSTWGIVRWKRKE